MCECGVGRRASASLTKPITIPLQLVRSLFAWALSLSCVSVNQEAIDRFDGSLCVCVCVNLLSVMMMIRGCLIPG